MKKNENTAYNTGEGVSTGRPVAILKRHGTRYTKIMNVVKPFTIPKTISFTSFLTDVI